VPTAAIRSTGAFSGRLGKSIMSACWCRRAAQALQGEPAGRDSERLVWTLDLRLA
jgi:hypothetical protein